MGDLSDLRGELLEWRSTLLVCSFCKSDRRIVFC